MKERFLLFLVFFLIINVSFVIAWEKTGEYQGEFDVDVGAASVIINSSIPTCTEDWTCSYYGECINREKTFFCKDCNSCGTFKLLPTSCGSVATCGESNGNGGTGGNGGGGGGGGGSSFQSLGGTSECVEMWECSAWSNVDEQCGTRICNDIAKCGTIVLKPAEERECETAQLTQSQGNVGAGITGGVIGAISNPAVASGIFIVVVLAAFVIVVAIRKRK